MTISEPRFERNVPEHHDEVLPVLNQRYKLIRPIGEGSMGRVFLIEDLKLCGKQWAVKRMECVDRARQLSELELLSRLDHRHLPRIVDFFFAANHGHAYLVMDYIRGQTLQSLFLQQGRRLELAQMVRFALQICELYRYLHEFHDPPIIHRDLKPENIMIDEEDQVKVIDFGIARQYKPFNTTDTLPCATLGFASPEQLAGKQTDARSDLYSLGALLFYLLSGGELYSLEKVSIASRLPDYPSSLCALLQRLLAGRADDRIQSASEVKEHLLRELERLQSDRVAEHADPERYRTGKNAVVIGCRGSEPLSACTHASIMLARYLAANRFKVALLECNDQPCFRRWIEQSGGQAEQSPVTHAEIDFYLQEQRAKISSLLHAGYDFIVVDFGSDLDEWMTEEFERSDLPLVTCFGSPPRLQRSLEWWAKAKPRSERWQLLISLGETQSLGLDKRTSKVLNSMNSIFLPASANPLLDDLRTTGVFDSLCSPWMVRRALPVSTITKKYKQVWRITKKLWQR